MKIKIGYQGVVGANTERATNYFLKEFKDYEVEIIELVNSINVVNALKNKEIDYGVMAVKNSTCGTVLESVTALKGEPIIKHLSVSLPVHHHLYMKQNGDKDKITYIISHQQALMQCKNNLKLKYPKAKLIEIDDTAVGAKWLAEGLYSDNCAVLCTNTAGELYNLLLIEKHLQDNFDNMTDFTMYKLK